MRKVIGLILLLIGIAMVFKSHAVPADGMSEAARTGHLVGQYTADALFVVSGVYLLVTKGKRGS